MTTHSDVLDKQLDTYGQIARRRVAERATESIDGPSHWKRFAAATGATLAGVAAADAAVVHVVPPTPIRVLANNNQQQVIDMDGDEQDDFGIGAFRYENYYNLVNYFAGVAVGLEDAQIIGSGIFPNSSYYAVKKFQPNEVISAVQPAQVGSYLRTSVTAGGVQYQQSGNWFLDETGFAGIVLGLNSQPRAGWIQIKTVAQGNRLRAVDVLSWAYETVPGVSIKAGQTSSGTVPGDYDGNGTVGTEDYTLWKSTFGNTVTAGTAADGNKNGKIDAADYTVWRNILDGGSGALSSDTAVPEPATVSLGVLALGAAGVAALRRRANLAS
jgi:hypothetical protein